MAQLVERYVRNVQATSSNLVISTSKNLTRIALFGLGFSFYGDLPIIIRQAHSEIHRYTNGIRTHKLPHKKFR